MAGGCWVVSKAIHSGASKALSQKPITTQTRPRTMYVATGRKLDKFTAKAWQAASAIRAKLWLKGYKVILDHVPENLIKANKRRTAPMIERKKPAG